MSKDYQTIKVQIQENLTTDLSTQIGFDPYRMNAVDDVGHDFFYISRSDEFRRLNAYVSQITSHRVLDPDDMFKQLSIRLSVVGLTLAPFSFKDEGQEIDGVEIEVEQYGGYAHGEDGGIVPYAISDKIPGGLFLVLSWVIDNGMYIFTEAYFASGAELDEMAISGDEEEVGTSELGEESDEGKS